MKPILYYIHDPMCSWCWGFKESFQSLLKEVPDNIPVVKLLGGLAKDSDSPMSKEMQNHIQANWKRIEATIPNVKFNYDFWQSCSPRRSTYPACRAVIAARLQHISNEDTMIRAIQSAYYEQARNPSEISTLVEIAKDIGLDSEHFQTDMLSNEVEQVLQSEIQKSRDLGVNSYPSLVLQIDTNYWPIPVDYRNSDNMRKTIDDLLQLD